MPPKKSNLSTTGGPSRGGGRGARGSQSTSTRGAARGGRGRGGRPQNPPAQTQDADDDDEDEDEDGHAGQQTTTQAQGRGQAKRRRAPNDDDEEPTGATRRRVDNTTQVTSHAPATFTDWDRVAQHVLNQPLPVERRAAYPPTQGPTPAPRNAEERNERIQALRNQLRVPYALGDLLLVGFLNGSGWDVNRAAALFWEGENRDIGLGSQTVPFGAPLRSTQQATPAAAAGPQLPPIPPPPTVINTVRRGENVEQGRILLVVDMQLGLRSSAFANRPRLRTTNANMTLLLHENRWVRDDASHEVSRRNGDYDTLTERMARLRISTEDENSRDERLALLISITSTNSWCSARRLLETNNWDLALAIDEWIRRGGVPLVDAPAQTRKDREEYKRNGRRSWNANKPRRMLGSKFYDDDEEKDPLGPPETEIEGGDSKPLKRAQPGQGTTNVDAGGNARNNTTTKRVSRRGFLIDANRDRAIIGATDASKLRLEYIRDGRYRYEHFDGADPDDDQRTKRSNFRWNDKKSGSEDEGTGPEGERSGSDSEKEEFDWNKRAHISKLNRWRSDRHRELTGESKRTETRTPFNKYEKDWLREQEAIRTEERFYELAQQDRFSNRVTNPHLWNHALSTAPFAGPRPYPMHDDEVDRLMERFNTQFAGKTWYLKILWKDGKYTYAPKDMGKVGSVPRPARTVEAIRQERRRIKAYAKHFHLEYDGDVPDGDLPDSESDSDFEDERKA